MGICVYESLYVSCMCRPGLLRCYLKSISGCALMYEVEQLL